MKKGSGVGRCGRTSSDPMTPRALDAMTRELFELVPGCRPRGLRLHTAGWFVETNPGRNGEPFTDYQFCNPDTSAALIHVVVERWLGTKNYAITIAQPGELDDAAVVTVNKTEGRGPTVLHALIDAALKIAKGARP